MNITRHNKRIKMSIDEIWSECIRMWHDCCFNSRYKNLNIQAAKYNWLLDNGYEYVYSNCFFCATTSRCETCPGVLVDKDFKCYNKAYSYETNRLAFYNKLLELNAIRMKKQRHICLAQPVRSIKQALHYLTPCRLTLRTNPRVHAWLWWNF